MIRFWEDAVSRGFRSKHRRQGRLGEVSHAADVPMGIAGNNGRPTAFEPDADIPAVLRVCAGGAMEALGVQLDFSRDSLVLPEQGWGAIS